MVHVKHFPVRPGQALSLDPRSGAVPEPYRISEALRASIEDYRLLLDRGYPVKATVQLVGNRHGLERAERIVLFRGVLDRDRSALIRSRTLARLPGEASLAVDGYNVLFTIANYMKGHPLFVATDGLLRDAGGAHGRFGTEEVFGKAAELLLERLAGPCCRDASAGGDNLPRCACQRQRQPGDVPARRLRTTRSRPRSKWCRPQIPSSAATSAMPWPRRILPSPLRRGRRCTTLRGISWGWRFGATFPDIGAMFR